MCKLAQDSERLRILLYDLLAYGPQNPYLLVGVSSLAQVWGAPLMATSGSSNLCIDVFQGVLSSVFPLAEESLGKDLAARYYTVLVKTLGWQPHDNQVPLEQTLISLLQGYEDPASSPGMPAARQTLIFRSEDGAVAPDWPDPNVLLERYRVTPIEICPILFIINPTLYFVRTSCQAGFLN